jgi:hypothetical protein
MNEFEAMMALQEANRTVLEDAEVVEVLLIIVIEVMVNEMNAAAEVVDAVEVVDEEVNQCLLNQTMITLNLHHIQEILVQV